MAEQFLCWQCGETLAEVMLPFSRRQVCDHCNADQHVCRMCHNFDLGVSGQCTEDRAEDITEKERANFCDYFSPNPQAYSGQGASNRDQAKAKLDALFGDSLEPDQDLENDKTDSARKALDDLFSTPDKQ